MGIDKSAKSQIHALPQTTINANRNTGIGNNDFINISTLG